jgi:gliding motility-associated-like protein
MTYGDGNGGSWSPLTSVDICGHEVSHAVTTNSAGLIYRYESGALNESFSDIFGNAIEYYADSTQFNWGMGEDITSSGRGIRNMAKPNDFKDPDTYKGDFWHTAPSDNGGVHVNSGVQNYWFYLLTKGISGTNDNGDSFKVDSIGIKKAQQIAFRNLTSYLTPSSNYKEARYYAIQSAADLYGECSDEVIATTNAWYAVGVGPEYDSSSITVDFSADTLFCFSNDIVPFRNESFNTKSYSWIFGDGNSSVQKNPTNVYGAQGKYTVKLIAEGCFLGVKDSMEKVAYIEIDSLRDICEASLPIAGQWTTYNVCEGFVYDHGGESNYSNLTRDTITLNFGISDSAYLTFSEFAYEEGYDSVYIYNGPNTSSPLIGGFTGDSIPNGGNPIKINSGAVTLRHFSDQLAVLSGYKAEFKAFRPSLSLTLTPDTTVCFNQPIWLTALGAGGSYEDYSYIWNGVIGKDSLLINFTSDTTIYLRFGDDCMQQFIYDSVVVKVLDPLNIDPIADTTLCFLEDIKLNAVASGGVSSNHQFEWLPFNLDTNNWVTQFRDDEVISVIVSDGCTPKNDTTTFNVMIRDSLSHTQQSPSLICQGESVTLRLDPTGGLSSYNYLFSDGTSSGKSSFVEWIINPLGSGQYAYWISYTDQCTQTNDTAFYTFIVRDSLSIDVTQDTLICLGQSLTLKANPNGGNPLGYQYDWGRGKTTIDSLVVNPSVNTSYTVSLSDGCSLFEPNATITVSLRDPLQVSIFGKDTACYGENVTYKGLVTGGDFANYTYKWNYGAGNSQNYTLPILFSNQKVVVQVDDGCSPNEVRDSLYVVVRPQLNIGLPSDLEICLGDSYEFSPSASGGISSTYQYSWNNGLGIGRNKTVKPSTNTIYVVTLTDNCSQPVIAKSRIVVNPLPLVVFDVSPNPSCVGSVVNFSNQTNTGLGSRFKWSFGDGNTSDQENVSHVYNTARMHSIKLVVTNEFDCKDSVLKIDELEIIPSPKASFTHTPDIANYYQPDFVFTNTSTDATNYSWDFGDGGLSAGFGASHSYADTGFYSVTLTAENSIGCTNVFSKIVQVEDAFKLFTPNAFSPNADNKNDEFSIKSRGVKEFSIMIFNRWGEILFQTSDITDSWDGTFDGKEVQEGIYYYSVYGKDYKNEAFQEKGNLMLLR